MVHLAVDAVRDTRRKIKRPEPIHLLIAGPGGFGVLLGMSLATLPPMTTYEYETGGADVHPATITT